jgi:PAS domain S-box-containing protein
VNPAFTKISGFTFEEVRGKNPRIFKSGMVMPEVFIDLWKTILSGNVWHGELVNRRKDGKIITEEQTIAPVRDTAGNIIHFIAIKQDITERKRAESALSKRSEQIATLNRVMQTVSSTLDISRVLDMILREIQQVIPYDSASVWLCKDNIMEIIAVHGFPDPGILMGTKFDLSSEDTPNTEVMRNRVPLIIGDAYESYKSFRMGVHDKYKHRGWMGVPMVIGDRAIGMLAFDKKIPNYYTQEQAQFALTFAAQAAIAIENARLYSDAQRELIEKIRAESVILQGLRSKQYGS